MKKCLFLAWLPLAATMASCVDGREAVELTGRIDEAFYQKVKTVENGDFVLVASGGGDTEWSAKSGQSLIDKEFDLFVNTLCSSGCAEFLIPAAQTVTVSDGALIGYHWSPIHDFHLIRKQFHISEACFPYLAIQREVQAKAGMNEQYWLHVRNALNPTDFAYFRTSECGEKQVVYENEMWFPDRAQMKELIGLSIEGSLCADNVERCTSYLNTIYQSGQSFMVGTQRHVVP